MYCVIVGDIIGSKEIGPEKRERVSLVVRQTFDRLNAEYADSMMAGLDTVRGDGFECVLLAQAMAPRIIMEIIKAFYAAEKTKVRVSVVLGELVTSGTNVNQADGPAFHAANAALERLKEQRSDNWLQVSMETGSIGQPLLDGTLALLTALTTDWTEKQRECVWAMEALDGQKSLVSAQLGRSPTVINKQLRAAHYPAYRKAWDSLEAYLIALEEAAVAQNQPRQPSYTAYFGMGQRMLEQKRYGEAVGLFVKALTLAKEALGEDDPQLIPLYNALSRAYVRKGESLPEAKDALDQSFRIQEGLPAARIEMAQTILYRGVYRHAVGQLQEAAEDFDRASKLYISLVGEYHPYVQKCYHNIGTVHLMMDDYSQAAEYFQKELEVLDHISDASQSSFALAHYSSGVAYCFQKHFDQALPALEKALELYKTLVSPKDERIVRTKKLIQVCWDAQNATNPKAEEV